MTLRRPRGHCVLHEKIRSPNSFDIFRGTTIHMHGRIVSTARLPLATRMLAGCAGSAAEAGADDSDRARTEASTGESEPDRVDCGELEREAFE